MLLENSRGNVSDAVSKWFTGYRRRCGVGAGKGERSEVTFHCFRNTVITRTMIKDVDRKKLKQLIGHEAHDPADITTRYEGAYPLEQVYQDVVLKALNFDEELGLKELLGKGRG